MDLKLSGMERLEAENALVGYFGSVCIPGHLHLLDGVREEHIVSMSFESQLAFPHSRITDMNIFHAPTQSVIS